MAGNSPNTDIQLEVSGLYGPGVFVSWVFLIVSAYLKVHTRRSRRTDPVAEPGYLRYILTAEVVAILLYPTVAAGDVAVRLADNSTDWAQIRTQCRLFDMFMLTVRDIIKPEESSQELVSKCIGLRLPLEIARVFISLTAPLVPSFLFNLACRPSAWPHYFTSPKRTVAVIVATLPPLWCLAVAISAAAKVGATATSLLIFLVFGLFMLCGYVYLYAVSLVFCLAAACSWVSLTATVLEIRAGFDPRGRPPLRSRAFRDENLWRLARVVYFLLLGTLPLAVATYCLHFFFTDTGRSFLFLDGIAGMNLTELDQAMSLGGGLVSMAYSVHSAGVLARVRPFLTNETVSFRNDWDSFKLTRTLLLPRSLERGERRTDDMA